MTPVLALLLALPAAAAFDPELDRAAMTAAASAAYAALVQAAGLPLEATKVVDINGGMNEGLRRAQAAAAAETSLETACRLRLAEMTAALKATEMRTAQAAEPLRIVREARAALGSDVEEAKPKIENLTADRDAARKVRERAADALKDVDAALASATADDTAVGAAREAMKSALRRANLSGGELFDAGGELGRAAAAMVPEIEQAKARVDVLVTDASGPSRTRATERLAEVRETGGRLQTAADRTDHRSDELNSQSKDFARALLADAAAEAALLRDAEAAKAALARARHEFEDLRAKLK